jgi:hypothetical protein
MNGAQSLFKALVDAGITTCFANPGTSEMQLVYEIGMTDKVRPVLCLQEDVVTGAAARRCSRDTATLDAWITWASMPADSRRREGGRARGGGRIQRAARRPDRYRADRVRPASRSAGRDRVSQGLPGPHARRALKFCSRWTRNPSCSNLAPKENSQQKQRVVTKNQIIKMAESAWISGTPTRPIVNMPPVETLKPGGCTS